MARDPDPAPGRAASERGADLDRLRALIDLAHRFPGSFSLSVIARSGSEVATAIGAVVEQRAGATMSAWQQRPSGSGRYTSHRLELTCDSVDDVIALYVELARLPGVMTIL